MVEMTAKELAHVEQVEFRLEDLLGKEEAIDEAKQEHRKACKALEKARAKLERERTEAAEAMKSAEKEHAEAVAASAAAESAWEQAKSACRFHPGNWCPQFVGSAVTGKRLQSSIAGSAKDRRQEAKYLEDLYATMMEPETDSEDAKLMEAKRTEEQLLNQNWERYHKKHDGESWIF